MELNIIEEAKNRLVFGINGEGHTFCNLLKDALNSDKSVKVASYNIKHPLVGVPYMIVETDGDTTPKSALTSASKKVLSLSEKFKQLAVKELK